MHGRGTERGDRLRVLHVCNCLSRSAGGVFYAVSGLVKAQRRVGVEAAALGGADGFFAEDRQHWESAPLATYRASGRYGLSADAFHEILSFRPNLLHVHGTWSAVSIYARFAQLAGVPVVVSPHGMLDPWIVSRRRFVKGAHAAMLERPLLRGGHVHALNESERRSVLAFARVPDHRVRVFPNGVDEQVMPVGGQRRGFLYLGRLHPKKQVKELVAAWAASDFPTEEPLMVAGWGEADYEAELKAAAKGSARVRFLGSLYGEPKTEVLLAARAIILPSLSEGLPMAVLEALQHGCLPIITEQCNLPELFADRAALQVNTDLSNLREVATKALAVTDENLTAQAQFLSDYSRRYLWTDIARDMAEWYKTIVAGRTAQPAGPG